MKINDITARIIASACKVHSVLGPGLLEEPYKQALKYQINKDGLTALSEVTLPVHYDGVVIECGYRLDLLIENLVIVELKSVNAIAPIHKKQLITYLKLSNKPVGLLLNFNVQSLKDGIVQISQLSTL